MSEQPSNKFPPKFINKSSESKHHTSYINLPSRTSITKTNAVRFGINESCTDDSFFAKKHQFSTTIQEGISITRSALKKGFVRSQVKNKQNDTNEQIFHNLVRLDSIKLPMTLRRWEGQATRLVTNLLNTPVYCNSSVMKQLKCFMSNSSKHDSYLLTPKLINKMKQKLREINSCQNYSFGYDIVSMLIKKIEDRCSNSEQLLSSYEILFSSQQYPFSVQLMIMYIGIYLHSINSSFQRAEEICRRMLNLMLRLKLEQYIPIYLILMIKLKATLCEWTKVVSLISKALAAAWVQKLIDLQIWCYFEFSRAYFALGNNKACEFFKQRSEMSIGEQQDTIYREMMQQNYKNEIELMRIHNYYFNLDTYITHQQLTDHNQRQKSQVSLKAQVYAKSIAQNFKLRHVKNLIGRLGEDSKHIDSMKAQLAGNPQFLTHQSGIKNLNVYFRIKHKRGDQKKLYTFENSSKNKLILKEMLRNLLLQMKHYVPILDC